MSAIVGRSCEICVAQTGAPWGIGPRARILPERRTQPSELLRPTLCVAPHVELVVSPGIKIPVQSPWLQQLIPGTAAGSAAATRRMWSWWFPPATKSPCTAPRLQELTSRTARPMWSWWFPPATKSPCEVRGSAAQRRLRWVGDVPPASQPEVQPQRGAACGAGGFPRQQNPRARLRGYRSCRANLRDPCGAGGFPRQQNPRARPVVQQLKGVSAGDVSPAPPPEVQPQRGACGAGGFPRQQNPRARPRGFSGADEGSTDQ